LHQTRYKEEATIAFANKKRKNSRYSSIYKHKIMNASFGDGSQYGSNRLPEPFSGKYKLYAMHFFFTFVSRMWDMGIVLLIAEITNNSLYFVGLAGLLGSLSIFLFMSNIGVWLDETDRLEAVKLAITIKIIAVSIAYIICAIFEDTHEGTKFIAYTLPILCAITALSFKTITQSIEKDWLVVLSDGDSAWLTSTNSIMTQIDLTSSTAAPAVTGFIFSYFKKQFTAIVLLSCNAAATVFLWYFVHYLYTSWPTLGSKHLMYDTKLRRRTDLQKQHQDQHQGQGQGQGQQGINTTMNVITAYTAVPVETDPPSTKSAAVATESNSSNSDSVSALAKTLGDFYDDDDDDNTNHDGRGIFNPPITPTSNIPGPSTASLTSQIHNNNSNSNSNSSNTAKATSLNNATSQRNNNTTLAQTKAEVESGSGSEEPPIVQNIPLHPYLECIPGTKKIVEFYRKLLLGYKSFKKSGCAGIMVSNVIL
jgi:hypothetical protein